MGVQMFWGAQWAVEDESSRQDNKRALLWKTNTDNWTSCAACRETRRNARLIAVHMKLFFTGHAQDVVTSLTNRTNKNMRNTL